VARFAATLAEYGVSRVTGDAHAGETFRADFQRHGVAYQVSTRTRSELYRGV